MMATCYDCIHCDVCSGIGACSYHCSDVSKCKHFRNKADFVEVVRCMDCKYCSHHYSIPLEEDIYQCRFEFGDDYPVPMVEATFYCGYGERRDK